MTVEAEGRDRHRHIDGFVDSFVAPAKRERYRSLLLHSEKRRGFIDGLNHKVLGDLIAKYLVDVAPRTSIEADAYLIADDSDLDDTFVSFDAAIKMLQRSQFVIIASFVPGVVAALKDEAPAEVRWLHR